MVVAKPFTVTLRSALFAMLMSALFTGLTGCATTHGHLSSSADHLEHDSDAFDRLSRSDHTLRDEVDRSGSPEARVDLSPVTQDYLDVERDMGGYPASDRYAEEGDRSER